MPPDRLSVFRNGKGKGVFFLFIFQGEKEEIYGEDDDEANKTFSTEKISLVEEQSRHSGERRKIYISLSFSVDVPLFFKRVYTHQVALTPYSIATYEANCLFVDLLLRGVPPFILKIR